MNFQDSFWDGYYFSLEIRSRIGGGPLPIIRRCESSYGYARAVPDYVRRTCALITFIVSVHLYLPMPALMCSRVPQPRAKVYSRKSIVDTSHPQQTTPISSGDLRAFSLNSYTILVLVISVLNIISKSKNQIVSFFLVSFILLLFILFIQPWYNSYNMHT